MLKHSIELLSASDGTATSTEYTADLATYHNNLGLVLRRTDASGEAAAEFKEAIRIGESLVATSEHVGAANEGLAASYTNLASIEELASPIIAEEHNRRSIALLGDLVKADPVNRLHRGNLARSYNNLGYLASQRNAWKRAEVCYSDAIQLQETLVNASPNEVVYRRDLAVSYTNLGMAESGDNRFDEAEKSLQKAAGLQDALLAANPNNAHILSDTGNLWNNLGSLYDKQQRFAEAGTPTNKRSNSKRARSTKQVPMSSCDRT